MARGIEREAPKMQKALRRIADANVGVGRSERDAAKAKREREKADLAILKVGKEIEDQTKKNNDLLENQRKLETDLRRAKSNRSAARRELKELKDILETKKFLHEANQRELADAKANRDAVKSVRAKPGEGSIKKAALNKMNAAIRDMAKRDAGEREDLADWSRDLASARAKLTEENKRATAAQTELNKAARESESGTKRITDLTDGLNKSKERTKSLDEAQVRSGEDVEQSIRRQRDALMAYNGALDESSKRHKKHGNEMNLVGRMLTDIPFVPGGRAGAVIGSGVVMIMASVAEAAVTASQAIAALPAVATAGGAALGTLALGAAGFGEALKNMGPNGNDPKQFALALQSLSPAAQQAALEIQALTRGPLKGLKDATQESLFAGVPEMLHNAAYTFMEPIKRLTGGLSASMNNMFGNALGQLASPEGMKSLENIINNIVTAFQRLEPAVAPFISAWTKIIETGSGFLPGFADAITNAAIAFNNFITKAQEDGSLQNFIQKGIDALVFLKDLFVEIGKRIFDTFGNKSPEEFRNTLNTTVDAVFSIINSIVGLSHVVNDLLGPIQRVADAIGGWERVIQVAAGAFVGFKLVGLGAATALATAFTGAGATAAGGFAGKLSTGLMGFGWAAVGAAIAIPILGALDNKVNEWISHKTGQQMPGQPGGAPERFFPQTFPIVGSWEDIIRRNFTDPDPNAGILQPGQGNPNQGILIAPGGAIVQPGQGGLKGSLPNRTSRVVSPPGVPGIGLPPGAPPFDPHDVPGVPGKEPSAADRRAELENQLANDPRFAVDPFAPIAGMPGISPQVGAGGPGGIEYRQPNPYEKGSYGTYVVDPQKVGRELNDVKVAAREWGDSQRDLAIVEGLRKENLATQLDVLQAQQARDDKEQSFIEARQNLVKAEQGTFDKINQGTKNLQDVQQQIGAKIDQDFGISKGLPGIFENLFKVIANMAMAPVIGALAGVTAVAGTAGPGTGLLGAFSPRKNLFGTLPSIIGGALPEGMVLGPDGYGVSADSSQASPAALSPGVAPNISGTAPQIFPRDQNLPGSKPQGLKAAIDFAKGASGKPHSPKAVGPNAWDCSGLVSDIYAVMTGKPYQGNERYFTTENFAEGGNFAELGFAPGFDPNSPLNVGVRPSTNGKAWGPGAHMTSTLDGVNVESGGEGTGSSGPNQVRYGGTALGAQDLPKQFHFVGLPGGAGAGTTGSPALTAGGSGMAGAVVAMAQAASGTKYKWGGSDLAAGLSDCSGAVSDLVELITQGQATGARLFNAGPNTRNDLTKLGAVEGAIPGALQIGWSNTHMRATLPNGVPFESGGSTNQGATYGGNAQGAAGMPNIMSIPVNGTAPMAGAYSPGSMASLAGGIPIPLPVTIVGAGGGGLPGLAPMGAPPGSPASGVGAGPLPGPGQGGLSPEQWNNIAGAEAGGNWSINSGNGYSGGLQFTPETWNANKPAGAPAEAWQATPEQQMAAGNSTLAAQGPGAWPATSAAHPDWFAPTSPGAPINIGSTGTSVTPALGRTYGEGRQPSEGFSIGGIAGMASGAAGAMPGMGMLAQIGIDEMNRAIQAGAQLAGIGVEGLMETFLPVESELADPARGWAGRILGAFAGVKPVAENVAGLLGGGTDQQGPQGPLTPEQVAAQKEQDHLGQGAGSPGPGNINVNIDNSKTPDIQSDVGVHQERANAAPGRVGMGAG